MNSNVENIAVIVLAAGKGTRMKSDKAKVLHELNGKPMISFVVKTAQMVAGDNVIVVIGHQGDLVKDAVMNTASTRFCIQKEQKGTGHAVMCALPEIPSDIRSVVVLCGDVPMIQADTIQNLIKHHDNDGCAVTVLAVDVKHPAGYGRIIMDDKGCVTRIVEEADANQNEKKITLINAGIYCIDTHFLRCALGQIKDDNAQGELYLTDIISVAHQENEKIGMSLCPSKDEVLGINTCDDLDKAQSLMSCK